MVENFAHEVTTTHLHSGDSSSPAIYIGIITLIALVIVITAVIALSRDSGEKKRKTEDQTKQN